MQLTVYSCILLISWIGAQLIVSSGATTFTTGDLMRREGRHNGTAA